MFILLFGEYLLGIFQVLGFEGIKINLAFFVFRVFEGSFWFIDRKVGNRYFYNDYYLYCNVVNFVVEV